MDNLASKKHLGGYFFNFMDIKKIQNESTLVVLAMDTYGNQFIKNISNVINTATIEEQVKFKMLFSDLWNEYLEIGERINSAKDGN